MVFSCSGHLRLQCLRQIYTSVKLRGQTTIHAWRQSAGARLCGAREHCCWRIAMDARLCARDDHQLSSKASGYTKPCLLADVSSSQNKRPSPCASRAPAATTCPTTRAVAKHRNVACRHVGANLKACSKALVDCLARSSPHHQEITHRLSTARYLTGDTALLHPAKICSECLA